MEAKCGMYVSLQLLVLWHSFSESDGQGPGCLRTTTCPCCKPGTCPPDRSGVCGGNCIDGYHGSKCWNKCPDNCLRCVDFDNCTQCKDGYYSTPTQCQLHCPSGCRTCISASYCTECKYGYSMTAYNVCVKCNDTCSTCNLSSLCTPYKSGYFLEQDTGWCRECSLHCMSCTSRNTCICSNGCVASGCNQTTGECYFGCKDNFEKDPTYKCDTCLHGMYGYQCNTSCNENCESTCDRITGLCTACKPGFQGDYCNGYCPGNCVSTCNRTTGKCFACKEGYHGNMCTLKCQTNCRECIMANGTCTTCVDGSYGDDCDRNCSRYCIINRCNILDGGCECVPGYVGDTCHIGLTTSTTPRFPRDEFPLVVTASPDNYVGEAIGLTVAGIMVIAGVIGGVIVLYRRRKRNLLTGTLPVINFKAETSDEDKLKAKLGCINETIATLDAKAAKARDQRAEIEAQLKELDRKMPYRHTERADVIKENNTYEMLQPQKRGEHGHYMSIRY